MNFKISVIVIGYNIQDYIKKCIESILYQSFDDYEVIFVNDGSKDNTLEIVSQFKDKIKIINKKNGGIVSARKAGFELAEGEYVTFIDGDDWLNIDFLSNLYEPIKSNGDIDIVFSDFYFQNIDGTFKKEICNSKGNKICNGYEFFDGIMIEEIDHHMFPKLYRKEFVLNAGYLDYPEISMAEDWITNAFFGLFKPNVFFSNTTNYFYRFNRGSVLRKGGKKLLEEIKSLNYMEEYFKNNCDFDYTKKMDYVWFSYTRTYVLTNTETSVKKEIIKAYKSKCINYEENIYCVASINGVNKKDKIRKMVLLGEMKFPILIPLFDWSINFVKKIIRVIKERKSKNFEKKLNLLYDSYINSFRLCDDEKKIYLIGTSDRSNLGDHAIALSEMNFLREKFPDYAVLEITGDTFRNRREQFKGIINSDNIICITGGGFLGDLWPDEEYMVNAILEDYPDNKVIIFPQTIFFYDEGESPLLRDKLKNYLKHKNLYLTARDMKTYDFYYRYFDEDRIGLFPDMALYLNGIENPVFNNEVMICLRGDKERIVTKNNELLIATSLQAKGCNIVYGSTLAGGAHNGDIFLKNRELAMMTKLKEFSKPRLIITDRLHGMILSTLAGTPCIVFDNLSKKVSGVYDLWLKDIDSIMFCNNMDNIEEKINNALALKHFRYTSSYLNDKKQNFTDFIKKVIGD